MTAPDPRVAELPDTVLSESKIDQPGFVKALTAYAAGNPEWRGGPSLPWYGIPLPEANNLPGAPS